MPQGGWGKPLNKLVGERLQRVRRSRTKPLTQQALSDRTGGGLSRSSIASIERGLQGISLAQLYALASALEVEPAELLPARDEVFAPQVPKIEELVRNASAPVATFLRKVQGTPTQKKAGGSA